MKKVIVNPSWEGAARIFIQALSSKSQESRSAAEKGLMQCAQVAQSYLDIFENKSVILENVDFKLLKEQKLNLLNDAEEHSLDVSGIIHLIDAIQDFAVDKLELPEEDVLLMEGE